MRGSEGYKDEEVRKKRYIVVGGFEVEEGETRFVWIRGLGVSRSIDLKVVIT